MVPPVPPRSPRGSADLPGRCPGRPWEAGGARTPLGFTQLGGFSLACVVGPSDLFARKVPLSASLAGADWVLMAGDETALPAIGTMLESLPDGARALVYVEVPDAAEEQRFATRGEVTVRWLHRDGVHTGHGELLTKAVREAAFPAGPVFAWLGGEAGAVRALHRHLVTDRKIGKSAIDFAGYWRSCLTQDDPPTGEDLADARELAENA